MLSSVTCWPRDQLDVEWPPAVKVVLPIGFTPPTFMRQPIMEPTELIMAVVGWTVE